MVNAEYGIVIYNVGNEMVSKANVEYGDFQSGGGYIAPGTRKSFGGIRYPIPDIATVSWKSNDGTFHEKKIEVKKFIPKEFSESDYFEIYFQIDGNNDVTVIPMKF